MKKIIFVGVISFIVGVAISFVLCQAKITTLEKEKAEALSSYFEMKGVAEEYQATSEKAVKMVDEYEKMLEAFTGMKPPSRQ